MIEQILGPPGRSEPDGRREVGPGKQARYCLAERYGIANRNYQRILPVAHILKHASS